jgi:hypothetical protein
MSNKENKKKLKVSKEVGIDLIFITETVFGKVSGGKKPVGCETELKWAGTRETVLPGIENL